LSKKKADIKCKTTCNSDTIAQTSKDGGEVSQVKISHSHSKGPTSSGKH